MKIFLRFSYHFFIIIWHFKAVFLSLIALIAGIAAVITHIDKMPFGEALYFSFITGLTIGYGDIVLPQTTYKKHPGLALYFDHYGGKLFK